MNVSFTLLDQALGTSGLTTHPHPTCSLVSYRSCNMRHNVSVTATLYVWTQSAGVYKVKSPRCSLISTAT